MALRRDTKAASQYAIPQLLSCTVLAMQGLLWSSLLVVAISISLLLDGPVEFSVALPQLMLNCSAALSLLTVLLVECTALLSISPPCAWSHKLAPYLRSTTVTLLRFCLFLWLASCTVASTFIIVQQPLCRSASGTGSSSWQAGTPCILQRVSATASFLATTIVFLLAIFQARGGELSAASLFNIVTYRRRRLELQHQQTHRPPYMASTSSFKCQSSMSTLVPSEPDLEAGHAVLQDKIVGLGIYTSPLLPSSPTYKDKRISPRKCSRTSSYSFLSARPSLAVIRDSTMMHQAEPVEPLPPMPVYPPRYSATLQVKKQRSTRVGAKSAVERPRTLDDSQHPTVLLSPPSPCRASPPAPVINTHLLHLATTKCPESSVYSRRTSGYGKDIGLDGCRNESRLSVITVKRSPLAVEWSVEDLNHGI